MYRYVISVLFLLFLIMFGCGKKSPSLGEDVFVLAENDTEAVTEALGETETCDSLKEEEGLCCVYVCGEVNVPGVYELPAGSRVYEAIQLAGGLTETADPGAVNQALFVEDGEMIQVFAQGEKPRESPQEKEEQEDGRVNLNTADISALMGIPGIGETKARSIIAYREENGKFQSAEDVMKITGIKEGLYSKMKDYITVK
ncbi:MAG: helix-hairpin-helix domain-containing protein [Lachnospiraceae bacterium]|nr:helix-hairpin-helix domain-containing protein [Lachnospiraceae bacterium]MDE6981951.1 helix-hairpin-helix domain-containing protein [Lachnospiraceae bacterium]